MLPLKTPTKIHWVRHQSFGSLVIVQREPVGGVWMVPWICACSQFLASESLLSESMTSESLALESLSWGESHCGFSLPSDPLPSGIPAFGIRTVRIPAFGIPTFCISVEFRHPLIRHPLDAPHISIYIYISIYLSIYLPIYLTYIYSVCVYVGCLRCDWESLWWNAWDEIISLLNYLRGSMKSFWKLTVKNFTLPLSEIF